MLRETERLLLDQGEECSRMGNMRYTKRITEVTRGLEGSPRVSHHLKQWFSKPGPYPAAASSSGNLSEIHILFKRFCFFFNLLFWLHQALVAAFGIFSCGIQTLSCSMKDLVS